MRRVLVLLIAQQATAQPRQQLLSWTAVACVCLALQFAVWPFDRANMDILNRTELRGLLVWLMSLFAIHFLVVLADGGSSILTIVLVLVVITANLAHYVTVVAEVYRFWLLQMSYRYTAVFDRSKAIARVMYGGMMGPLMLWLIRREEDRRRVSPKVFYDWSNAALFVDGPPVPTLGRPLRPARRAITAMQLTSAAVQDVMETLKLTHVPSDFHEFLWSHAFLVQSLRQKLVEMRSRRRDEAVVHLPRPDDESTMGLRHMQTVDLSYAFLNQCSNKVSARPLDSKTSGDGSCGQLGDSRVEGGLADMGEAAVVSPGITLYDLQANLCFVVDELIAREHHHQAALRRADGSDLERADGELHHRHSGGWRGLYEAFRNAKRTLIAAGSRPEAIPEVLASLAPTMIETSGEGKDVHISGASSPVSARSQQSDHPTALRPHCHVVPLDWNRLSSDGSDSAALTTVSISAEASAVNDAVASMAAANIDDED
mmetsp:Transcript_16854/g.48011  ORF Transcript_16854/g.48011 Transcript_16854/m.48011 type:complete len:486 (-) Transcript_16854:2208-3665(-)